MKALGAASWLCAALIAARPAACGEPLIDVPAAAREAVAAVDEFSAALAAGKLGRAGELLDPAAVILESGGAEHSAAEYLGGHAGEDAAFLAQARQQLLRRIARAGGGLAWVASESELNVQRERGPAVILSTETMVLRHTDAGWRIVHVHWSSRPRPEP